MECHANGHKESAELRKYRQKAGLTHIVKASDANRNTGNRDVKPADKEKLKIHDNCGGKFFANPVNDAYKNKRKDIHRPEARDTSASF